MHGRRPSSKNSILRTDITHNNRFTPVLEYMVTSDEQCNEDHTTTLADLRYQRPVPHLSVSKSKLTRLVKLTKCHRIWSSGVSLT